LTSGHDLCANKNLGTLISSIVTHFDQIIEVIINKDSHY